MSSSLTVYEYSKYVFSPASKSKVNSEIFSISWIKVLFSSTWDILLISSLAFILSDTLIPSSFVFPTFETVILYVIVSPLSYFPSSSASVLITSFTILSLYLLILKSFAILATTGTGTASGVHPTQSSFDTSLSDSSISVITFASVVWDAIVPSGLVIVVVVVPSVFILIVVVVPSAFVVVLVVVPSSFVVVLVVVVPLLVAGVPALSTVLFWLPVVWPLFWSFDVDSGLFDPVSLLESIFWSTTWSLFSVASADSLPLIKKYVPIDAAANKVTAAATAITILLAL